MGSIVVARVCKSIGGARNKRNQEQGAHTHDTDHLTEILNEGGFEDSRSAAAGLDAFLYCLEQRFVAAVE